MSARDLSTSIPVFLSVLRANAMNVMTNNSSVRARREAALQRANIATGFHNLVNGQRLAAAQTLDVIDPATGEVLAKVPDVDRSDLDQRLLRQPGRFQAGAARPGMCVRPPSAV
jgi:hypothetical protein